MGFQTWASTWKKLLHCFWLFQTLNNVRLLATPKPGMSQQALQLWVCSKSIACRLDEAGSFLFGAVYLQHAKKTNKKKHAIWGVTRNAIFMKCDSTASVLCNWGIWDSDVIQLAVTCSQVDPSWWCRRLFGDRHNAETDNTDLFTVEDTFLQLTSVWCYCGAQYSVIKATFV